MKEVNKQVEKPEITDANLAVKMRPDSRSPMAAKLKEVKNQKPQLNEMASGLANLVTAVSSAAMTSKSKDGKLKLENNDSFEMNAPSGSVSQMDTLPAPEAPQQLEAQLGENQIQHATDHGEHFNSQVGSKIEVVVGTVAPPEPMKTEEVTVAEVPQEPLQVVQLPVQQQPEHSESQGPQEAVEQPNPATMPDGSYGLYGSQKQSTEEAGSMREIGIGDGNLIFLTGGDGQANYNAGDSVAIGQRLPIYVLNTDENVVRYVQDSEGNVQLDMESVIEYLPEEHDGPVESMSNNGAPASPEVHASLPPLPQPVRGGLPDATPEIEALIEEGRVMEAPMVAAPMVAAPVLSDAYEMISDTEDVDGNVPSTSGLSNPGSINVNTFHPVLDSPSSPDPENPTGSVLDDQEGKAERRVPSDHAYAKGTWDTSKGFKKD
ncbi:uncharacterized protein [Drosophila bipectinata]|uniref:uncharacterized protein n=1 Tax=Drosophila bipectinata TaxID=42026 RepID=UPI001C8A0A55|nr:uncharacterized protein LOC108122705 [Drosophila bipectinata]